MGVDSGETAATIAQLARRIRVAQGLEPADLRLNGGHVVNVFTERIERADVVIADGVIAGVGLFDWPPAKQTIDCAGRAILPGLIDSHMHLESTLLAPGELARLLLPHGTTATISDSHEVGNVLGVPGIELLMAASEGVPLDLFFTASSCVPATRWDDAGAALGPAEVDRLLQHPRVLGLAEMMDFPAVLRGDADVLAKLACGWKRKGVLDGHAPGLSGCPLMGYAAAGIRSDHESTAAEEALAKAALGMLVQVREGSAARNLEAHLPLLASGALGDDWCLVTDDIFPDEIVRAGHLDGLLRRVVAAGVPPARAVRHASLVPARHYGLRDRGAIAPGYRADLAIVEDASAFAVTMTLKDGRVVAREGRCVAEIAESSLPAGGTIRLGHVDESTFGLRLSSPRALAIQALEGQIITGRATVDVLVEAGAWAFDPDRDVALVASLERHRATGRVGVGLASGFGFRKDGALASSYAHDSHNVIVAGTNARDMLAAVREIESLGGGFVVAAEGEARACLPLPFAGLLSLERAEVACRQLEAVNEAARALGCTLPAPFGTLSFLALPVIPELRITDQGMYDVTAQRFVRP